MKLAKFFGALALIASLSSQAQADSVLCHITYGGETRRMESQPVDSPYLVGTQSIGTFFLFRVVYQTQPADLASIKIYTYADRDGGPVIIHQASYPATTQNAAVNGFTGLNWVYEPLRDGELQYWCEMQRGEKTK
jgi:hypothetical protein